MLEVLEYCVVFAYMGTPELNFSSCQNTRENLTSVDFLNL